MLWTEEPGRLQSIGLHRVAAAFSSYDGDLSLPLGLALGSPIFPSGGEGKLVVALESLQGAHMLTLSAIPLPGLCVVGLVYIAKEPFQLETITTSALCFLNSGP